MKNLILLFLISVVLNTFGQTFDWAPLPQTVNERINAMTVYNNQLIAGGSFSTAGASSAKRIAAWNGTSWSSLGMGIKGGTYASVEELLVSNDNLYVAGNFDSAGTVLSRDIAMWDGNSWSGFGSGSNAVIYALCMYNGELHAGGTFTSIGGVSASHIAKWNGTAWEPLGSGLKGNNVNDLYVYQNELYAVGPIDSIGNTPCNNLARWNGSSWNIVSTGVPYGNNSLIEMGGRLIIGTNNSFQISGYPLQIWQWDFTNMSLFSQQPTSAFPVRRFLNYNNRLYGCIGAGFQLSGERSSVSVWNPVSSLWDSVGTRVNAVHCLAEFNGELYCAGNFKASAGSVSDYIAKLSLSTSVKHFSSNPLGVNVYPIPVKDKLLVEFTYSEIENSEITLSNSFGQQISVLKVTSPKHELDLGYLNTGIYYLQIETAHGVRVMKIIKE